MQAPLRAPASILSASIALGRSQLWEEAIAQKQAQDTAEFLLWTQTQAVRIAFPFLRPKTLRRTVPCKWQPSFWRRAKSKGRWEQTVRNGWIFADHGDGGLQFDNSECGVAMFEYYEWTKEPKYLESAKRAASWALNQPLCVNWNYNAFSVELLAKAYAVTNEAKYLDAAVLKATHGVLPGQLTDGPHAGRWLDPHNTRAPPIITSYCAHWLDYGMRYPNPILIVKRFTKACFWGFRRATPRWFPKDHDQRCLNGMPFTRATSFRKRSGVLTEDTNSGSFRSFTTLGHPAITENKMAVGPKAWAIGSRTAIDSKPKGKSRITRRLDIGIQDEDSSSIMP